MPDGNRNLNMNINNHVFLLITGLKLVLNLELHEYIPELTPDAGVKVSITEPNEVPFPTYNSLSLAPGFKNEIAMKRVNIITTIL